MANYGWRNDQGWRGDERRHWDQNQNRMRGYGPWSQEGQGQDEWRDNDRYARSRFGDDGSRWDGDDWRGPESDYQEQDYAAGYATPMSGSQGRFGSSGRYGRGDWRNQGRNYYSGSGYGGSMGGGYMGGGSMGGGYMGGGTGYMGGGYMGGPMGGGYSGYGDWQGRSYMGEARNRFAGGQGYGRDYDRSPENDRNFWNKATDEVASWVGDEEAGRRREMDRMRSHAGRGPKGYIRSDDRIREDINDRLTDDWQLDASDIEVFVVSGEVTLSGTVDSRQDKRRAEDLAENISGVRNVQNNLRVQPQQQALSSGMTGESQSSSMGTGSHGSGQSRQGSYSSTSGSGSTGTGSTGTGSTGTGSTSPNPSSTH